MKTRNISLHVSALAVALWCFTTHATCEGPLNPNPLELKALDGAVDYFAMAEGINPADAKNLSPIERLGTLVDPNQSPGQLRTAVDPAYQTVTAAAQEWGRPLSTAREALAARDRAAAQNS